MLKLTTTSYLHLFNTFNFNIFVHKSRSNARGIQLVQLNSWNPSAYIDCGDSYGLKAKGRSCRPSLWLTISKIKTSSLWPMFRKVAVLVAVKDTRTCRRACSSVVELKSWEHPGRACLQARTPVLSLKKKQKKKTRTQHQERPSVRRARPGGHGQVVRLSPVLADFHQTRGRHFWLLSFRQEMYRTIILRQRYLLMCFPLWQPA